MIQFIGTVDTGPPSISLLSTLYRHMFTVTIAIYHVKLKIIIILLIKRFNDSDIDNFINRYAKPLTLLAYGLRYTILYTGFPPPLSTFF